MRTGLLLLVLLASMAGPFTVSLTASAQQDLVAVPDLIGLTVPQAARRLIEAKLLPGIEAQQIWTTGAKAQPNQIIQQSPAAGEKVAGGTAITMTTLRTPNVKLEYNADRLFLTNLMDEPLNLNGVRLATGEGSSRVQFKASDWGKFLIAAHGCASLWTRPATGLTRPDGCKALSTTAVKMQSEFWPWLAGTGTFSVERYGQPVATCYSMEVSCLLALPQEGDSDNTGFLTFVYRTTHLRVENTTDQWVNLEGVEAVGRDAKRLMLNATQNMARGDVLWPGSRLAPKQCIIYSALEVGLLPPYTCEVVGYVKLDPGGVFWAKGFSIIGSLRTLTQPCAAPVAGQESLCVLPK
jgi:hypothetical protein